MQLHTSVNASLTHIIKFFFKPFLYPYLEYPIQVFLLDLLHHQLQKCVSHAYTWDTGKHSYFESVLKPVKLKERHIQTWDSSISISIIHVNSIKKRLSTKNGQRVLSYNEK